MNREVRNVREKFREAVAAARPGALTVSPYITVRQARALVAFLDRAERDADGG